MRNNSSNDAVAGMVVVIILLAVVYRLVRLGGYEKTRVSCQKQLPRNVHCEWRPPAAYDSAIKNSTDSIEKGKQKR